MLFCASQNRRAFTLIELLVVIAIISLLVSILLPSLNKAKELAHTVLCMSQLRSMGIATVQYQTDADGFFPPAGWESGYRGHERGYSSWWQAHLGLILEMQSASGNDDYLDTGQNAGVFACPAREGDTNAYGHHLRDYKVAPYREDEYNFGLAGVGKPPCELSLLRIDDLRKRPENVAWIVDGSGTVDSYVYTWPQSSLDASVGPRHGDSECNILWANNVVTTQYPSSTWFKNGF